MYTVPSASGMRVALGCVLLEWYTRVCMVCGACSGARAAHDQGGGLVGEVLLVHRRLARLLGVGLGVRLGVGLGLGFALTVEDPEEAG